MLIHEGGLLNREGGPINHEGGPPNHEEGVLIHEGGPLNHEGVPLNHEERKIAPDLHTEGAGFGSICVHSDCSSVLVLRVLVVE